MVHIYCGDGKGKTTAATGLAVRAAGSGMKVLFAQFWKNGRSSEICVLKTVPNMTCLFPEKTFGRYVNMSEEERVEAARMFGALLTRCVELSGEYGMVVLDESVSAYNYGMIDCEMLTAFLRAHPDGPEIVLTGREPADELVECADYVSEIREIKHPYERGIEARKGIEF